MCAYQFNKKTYCGLCYKKIVHEKEREPDHVLDGDAFYHLFQDSVVQCAGCGLSLHYRNFYTKDGSFRRIG
jgi:hypothetical protein